MDQCLNWIRKELFEESEFLVIYLVEMVMYSGGFCRICVCFVSVWDQGYIEGRFDSG